MRGVAWRERNCGSSWSNASGINLKIESYIYGQFKVPNFKLLAISQTILSAGCKHSNIEGGIWEFGLGAGIAGE